LNLTSAISGLANRDILVYYVSSHNAMAYDTHRVDSSITKAHGGLERWVMGGKTELSTSNDELIETLTLNKNS
jgi:hypothetical protein